jgi:uncharacterized repeat protein (TIGR04052 family)
MAVTIDFRATIDGIEFACGDTYPGIGSQNTTVTPLDLRLFVQDVKLISQDGSEVPLALDVRAPWQSADVALLDFEDGTGNCGEGTPERNTKITGTVPVDQYKGIRFVNGVPEELNHLDPAQQDDPLKTFANLSWGWLGGFRFAKIELMEVARPNEPFGSGIFHVGSTACTGDAQAGTVTCAKPNRNLIALDDFDPDIDTVELDIAPIFVKTDLTETAECHATGDLCQSMFSAFGIDFATGKSSTKQTAFFVH